MTPTGAKGMYARQMALHGEQITLRRLGSPNIEKLVQARIIPMFSAADLVGAVQQIGRKAVITADDLAASGFPLPIGAKSDRIIVAGKTLTITNVDDTTRRIAGVIIAYEIELSGA